MTITDGLLDEAVACGQAIARQRLVRQQRDDLGSPCEPNAHSRGWRRHPDHVQCCSLLSAVRFTESHPCGHDLALPDRYGRALLVLAAADRTTDRRSVPFVAQGGVLDGRHCTPCRSVLLCRWRRGFSPPCIRSGPSLRHPQPGQAVPNRRMCGWRGVHAERSSRCMSASTCTVALQSSALRCPARMANAKPSGSMMACRGPRGGLIFGCSQSPDEANRTACRGGSQRYDDVDGAGRYM